MAMNSDFLCAGLLGICTTVGVFTADADVVWKIGEKDGKDAEFLLGYDAWEYGSQPRIPELKEMDVATHVYTWRLGENKAYTRINLPKVIVPLFEATFMPPEQIIAGVKLVWNEREGGLRKITFDFCKSANWMGIPDRGIVLEAPDGRRKSLQLPTTKDRQDTSATLSLVFRARPGENAVVLRNVTLAKHYKVWFDAITLETADDDEPPEGELYLNLNREDGICHPGDDLQLACEYWNGEKPRVTWTVKDLWGNTVAENALPTDRRGWFEISATAGKAKASTMYCVVEPVTIENIPESRFGCHETASDGYRLSPENSFQTRVLDKGIRRAALAGCRWVRLHSISWALREPEKGTYLFDDLDAKLARTFKWKMNLLLGIGQTPKWTSASTDMKLTCCGNYSYLYYPPKDGQAWGDFMKEVVRRYGDRIFHYEIGNEPGYTSAFWTGGDAAQFGTYLKIAYDAVKAVKPDAVVYPGAPLTTDFIDEACQAVAGPAPYDVMSAHYLGNGKRGATKTAGFIELAKRHGKKAELVNSEDMSWMGYGWTHGHDLGAANMVWSHVRDAANGVTRTFTFAGFHDFSDAWSFFTVRHEPRCYYAAYRAMTHRLERAKYVGSLSLADYEAYLFDRAGTPVIVAWRGEKLPTALRLGGTAPATVVDMMDVERAYPLADGTLTFELGRHPVYVEGGDMDFLKAQIDCLQALPKQLTLKREQRKVVEWGGTKLEIAVPDDAEPGVYDYVFKARILGRTIAYPIAAEVVTGASANRFVGGDFESDTYPLGKWWMKPNDGGKSSLAFVDGEGWGGSRAVRMNGMCSFGNNARVKARPGEKYVLSLHIKGLGSVGAMVSIIDKDGKRLNQKDPGLNCCCANVNGGWKRVTEEFFCEDPATVGIGVFFIANYGDTDAVNSIIIDDVVLARITDGAQSTKVITEGPFAATMAKASPLVLENGTTAKVALDGDYLSLRFDAKDDDFTPMPAEEKNKFGAYMYDSVQFAIDPVNDGRDRTQFTLFRDASGKCVLFKQTNYVTPELPENITRQGVVAAAEGAFAETADGWSIGVKIPLREVYPLSGREDAFGFDFVINDGDGKNRTHGEWASGIGDGRGPRFFGTLLRAKKTDPEQEGAHRD